MVEGFVRSRQVSESEKDGMLDHMILIITSFQWLSFILQTYRLGFQNVSPALDLFCLF